MKIKKSPDILTVKDIMTLFDINRKQAKKLIKAINRKLQEKGKVTIKNRVLKRHLGFYVGY